jgi:uncharacterized membrane protein (DUF2068 family)
MEGSSSRTGSKKQSRDPLLRMIAWLKLVKCTLLIVAGSAAIWLRRGDSAWMTEHWAGRIAAHYHVGMLADGVRWLCRLDPQAKGVLAAACFGYAALFATEGVGLWLEVRWAEYLTIVATGLLIPIELYEIAQRVTVLRCLALVANVLIVIYLIWRVWTKFSQSR